jgi:protein gp37
MAKRLKAMGAVRYENGFRLTLHPDLLEQPLKWKKPRVIFVNSMSDLFHPEVPFRYIESVFEVMSQTPHHVYQVLTKRSDRLAKLASDLPWPTNVWMGVSVEDQSVVNRVDDLRTVPAKIRFLSCEPLIGPLNGISLIGIHWVIVGGESGPGARPMQEEWVDAIRALCRSAGVAFFFKQWGGVRKDLAGRTLHGRTYDELPKVPQRYKSALASMA